MRDGDADFSSPLFFFPSFFVNELCHRALANKQTIDRPKPPRVTPGEFAPEMRLKTKAVWDLEMHSPDRLVF